MQAKKALLIVFAVALIGAGCTQSPSNDNQDDESLVGKVFNGAKQTIGSGAQKGGRFIKESGEGYIRSCYATSMEDLKEALVCIERFVNKYKR